MRYKTHVVRLMSASIIIALAMMLSGCPLLYWLTKDSGKTSSGIVLDLNGTYYLSGTVDSTSAGTDLILLGKTIGLKQTGTNVVSTTYATDSFSGTLCSAEPVITGTVTGSNVTLNFTSPWDNGVYRLTGTSDLLSGTIDASITSGPCIPTHLLGRVTFTKISGTPRRPSGNHKSSPSTGNGI